MIIDDFLISSTIAAAQNPAPAAVRAALARARALKGINFEDAALLLSVSDPQLTREVFAAAREVKNAIYGKRLVLFAPLYISNICHNECAYCAFRASNKALTRRALSQSEIAEQTLALIRQGHKRVLMVAGESYSGAGLNYVFDAVKTIYSARDGKNNIRRVNVNIAPLSVDEFKALAKCNIGTFQLFQETYHRPTYAQLHTAGKKADYDYRLSAMHRALEAGLHDVGIGALFGLYDYKYEVLAMLQHIKSLEDAFGIGPHTISVPRVEPACGSAFSEHPPHALSDDDFKKVIAVLRLAVPYTGIILSTRESAQMRAAALDLGVSQISAGSSTSPGGYDGESGGESSQFSLGDHRPLGEVILDVVRHGYIPSFCTGCYRLGRVGKDFMDMAKPGLIKAHCLPNAMFTFAEYLQDFAGAQLQAEGYALIEAMQKDLPAEVHPQTTAALADIKNGKRDIYL